MQQSDLEHVAVINAEAFPRQTLSLEWISCNFKAYPRTRYYVAEDSGEIIGFIQWTEKSGFREAVVLELEQMAVAAPMRRQGIGSALIEQSLSLVKQELAKRQATIKHILVTARTDNEAAQRLYKKSLKAFPEMVIANLYSADEVLMIARNIT